MTLDDRPATMSDDDLRQGGDAPAAATTPGASSPESGYQALEAYLDVLLKNDVDLPKLDVASLPGEQRRLGKRLVELGEFMREGQKLAHDLADGKLDALDSAQFNHENPLLPSLHEIKENLSTSLTLSTAVTADPDMPDEDGVSGNYILSLNAAVTELLEQKRTLEHRAYADALTGVGNRAAYERALEVYWERGKPFVTAFVDIDNLKSCNDRFGHAEGNRYIKTVCAFLTDCCKRPEEVFRIGGDEFVVLSPAASEQDMEQRLESCRERLMEENPETVSQQAFSFSYGCSVADPSRGDDRRQITLDADRKMYDYKLTHKSSIRGGAASYTLGDLDNRVFEALSMASEGCYPLVYNIDTRESHWSPLAVRDFGLPCEHIHDPIPVWLECVHPDDREQVRGGLERMSSGQEHNHRIQYRAKDCSGKYVLCESRGYRLEGIDDSPALYVGYVINRSAAEVTDAATGLGNFRALIGALGESRTKGCPVGLVGVKVNHIDEINRRYGYDAGDHVIAEITGRVVSRMRAAARAFRSRGVKLVVVADGATAEETVAFSRRLSKVLAEPVMIGGEPVQVCASTAALHYERIQVQPAKAIRELDRRVEDAASREFDELQSVHVKHAEQRSQLDRLTGLLIGSWFLDEAERVRVANPGTVWSMVKIDLGRMTIFNEWYGRDRGDALLAEVGSLLQEFEDDYSCTCGYWGQDDFCLFLPFDIDVIKEMYAKLKVLILTFSDSLDFLPAMGIYRLEPGEAVGQKQYEYARFATKGAKNMSGDRVRMFRTTEYRREGYNRDLIGGFEHAIANNEIMFHVQPQVDLETGEIAGCEALARWRRSDGSFISPGEFVPALEETGLISMLDKLIWDQVLTWVGSRLEQRKRCIPVSINVSRIDVLSFDVAAFLFELMAKHGVPAKLVRVEITESTCAEGADAVRRLIDDLRSRGVHVHMDDFGTGHSSLGMLGTVDIDVLKLDRQFVEGDIVSDARRVKVVRSIAAMAEALHMPIIAEGLETIEQVDLLRKLGARYAQGFYFHRPMECEQLDMLLDEGE